VSSYKRREFDCDHLKRQLFLFFFLVVWAETTELTMFYSNPVLSSRIVVGIEMSLKQLCTDLDINQATFTATLTYSLHSRMHFTHI